MKKSTIATIAGGATTVCIGVLSILWYGNQPIKEYYPNEAVKSITQRKMFQHTGKYQLFAQDGTLIEEYEQIKGIKNGKATIYFKDGSADFTYMNNKLSGPLKINSKQYEEALNGFDIDFADSTIQIKNGDFFESSTKITCDDDKFVSGLQAFLDVQNYDNFRNLFKCLNIKQASVNSEGGKCEYKGAYNFPKFLANSSIKCSETNTEILKNYTPDFDTLNSIADVNGVDLNVGNIGNIEKFDFDTDFNVKTGKISFDLTTVTDQNTSKQKLSLGGFEQLLESTAEFVFSPQEDADGKKFLASVLKNVSWSDWEASVNNHKRFSIVGDFNFANGFSDPYVMSYYSGDDVTTQWTFDGRGTRISSRYPKTNKPMMSFGLNVNDGFKKAYKNLINYGINAITTDFSSFDPTFFINLQNEAVELVKGVSSVSGILMDSEGKKLISGVMALQKNINVEEFMVDPTQFMNFKFTIYQNNQPVKVYIGNFKQGFTLNGRKLSDDDVQIEMQNIINEAQNGLDSIISELGRSYDDVNVDNANWLNSDIDPFLFGFYKGYTNAKNQYMTSQPEEYVEPAPEEYVEPAPVEEPAPENVEPAPVEEPAPENVEPAPVEEPAPENIEPAPVEEPAPENVEPAPVEEPAPEEYVEPAPVEEPAPENVEPAPENVEPAPVEEPAPENVEPAPVEEPAPENVAN